LSFSHPGGLADLQAGHHDAERIQSALTYWIESQLKPPEALTMISRYLAGLLLGLTSAASAADSSSCYNIADADARTYCLALAHNDPGRCYAIQDSALRSRCLAEIR